MSTAGEKHRKDEKWRRGENYDANSEDEISTLC